MFLECMKNWTRRLKEAFAAGRVQNMSHVRQRVPNYGSRRDVCT